ncbi:MAG: ATP-dependent helicase HrpB [bacterium]
MNNCISLPIDAVEAELKTALNNADRIILQAPPGAGKSTRVPLMLLDEPWLAGKKIIVLEPRRLAARAVAQRLAQALGEQPGERVGFRMRLESKVGPNTRIEVVTEGILARQIQADPELEGVGCVIFDEFHERSLQADTGLALCLDSQEALRDDLKLLLMSATLDAGALSRLLDNPPIVTSEGRQFPVETHYLAREEELSPARIAHHVLRASRENKGNVLVFLPGAGEIRRVAEHLEAARKLALEEGGSTVENTLIAPLYGGLDKRAQEAAIAATIKPQRKIVLATSIAETSLTIEGITVVVDAGLDRHPVFSPRSGMTRLITEAASLASAHQRGGRAGRLSPGVCYRLWPESDNRRRKPQAAAEILQADLAPLVLDLARWGVTDPAQMKWLDLPPPAHVAQARSLLTWLGALDQHGRITVHGEAMAALGTHPRLAHLLIRARQAGVAPLGCDIAALLGERSPIRGEVEEDFSERLGCLDSKTGEGKRVDRGIVARVRKQSRAFLHQLKGLEGKESGHSAWSAAQLLALAYPDRIAQRRNQGGDGYRLSGGGAASFWRAGALSQFDYLVVAELDGQQRESRIFSAIGIHQSELEAVMDAALETRDSVFWDDSSGAVVAERQHCLGALVLQRKELRSPDTEQVRAAMLEALRKKGLQALPWTDALREWQWRVILLRQSEADADGDGTELPDVRDEALLASLEQWLAPWMDGVKRLSQLKKLDLRGALLSLLTWPQQQRLEALMPTHFQVPSGSRIRLKYLGNEVPVLAVRLQEMFSCSQTPSIAQGKIPLQVHLLSPAQRPIQITQDLVGFWSGSYAEVKKELKGRYPKHHWPDDPLNTAPHRSVRPRC